MRLSTLLPYGGDPLDTADQVRTLEAAGIDMVWIPEVYTFDAVSQLGYLAAVTERIELGSGILPVFSRTPTLIATTAASLDSLSGGRFVLGLGASGPQVIEGWHGVPYRRPLGRTREVVEICRSVWRREPVRHQGDSYTIPLPADQGTGLGKPLRLINRPVREHIPIYVASIGPKNVRMTAEIADGWLPVFYHPAKAAEVWGDDLATGAAERDPALGPLEVVAGGPAAICRQEDAPALRDLARPSIALYVGGMGARGRNFYNDLFRRYGYEAEAEEIQDLYLAGRKREAEAAIPASFLEATSLIGDAGYVRDQVEAYRASGVTRLDVTPLGDDPVGTVAAIKAM
ncbi:MAG: LLM class F420-dependent oxidoreductase [Acidimicrobiia bacterium]|nr:LLM class F420-dependent oxidoreductase [Acidimicrobiia bacterium]